MSKEIKDYLHLYHPQSGIKLLLNDGRIGTYEGVTSSMVVKVLIDGGIIDEYINYVKPFLRDLSDMTEEEAKEYFKLPDNVEFLKRKDVSGKSACFEYRFKHPNERLNIEDGYFYSEVAIYMTGFKPNEFIFLLSKGFDIFGLIPAGLAIKR